MGFWIRNKGNLVVSHSGKLYPINELDVRILNISIRTFVNQVMVLLPRSSQLGQVRSARLGLNTCELQLRKVITSSYELRFWCS